jgi:hypothetical protein
VVGIETTAIENNSAAEVGFVVVSILLNCYS